eukprot:5702846-Amphidinium_carterae.1
MPQLPHIYAEVASLSRHCILSYIPGCSQACRCEVHHSDIIVSGCSQAMLLRSASTSCVFILYHIYPFTFVDSLMTKPKLRALTSQALPLRTWSSAMPRQAAALSRSAYKISSIHMLYHSFLDTHLPALAHPFQQAARLTRAMR